MNPMKHSSTPRRRNHPFGRLFLFAAAWVLCSLGMNNAHAQGIHLRGGLNLANAALDPEPASPLGTQMLRGYNGALLVELGGGPVRLMVGGGYQQQGIKVTGSTSEGDYKLDYATIPIMICLGPPSINANATVFLNVGVEPSFLIGSNLPDGGTILTKDELRDFDFAMRSELGAELPLSYSGPSLVLALAYSLGLTDANRGGNEFRNNTFQGIVGIKFHTF
jgi:hypothetical protein